LPHGQQFLWEFRAANSELIDLWHVRGAIRHEDQGIELIHVTDEEFEASMAVLREHGIEVEIVPGVTAAVAASFC
jgi:hypothetical protein